MPPISYAAEIAAAYREDHAHHDDAPALCCLCRQVVTEEDAAPERADLHDECWGQELEEELLALSIERLADELAEELADYARQKHAPAESRRTRINVELLAGVVRVMRQMIAPPPVKGS
jgi:hypothetical protein